MRVAQAREAARLIASRIGTGDIDPYDGAMRIWKDVLDKIDTRIPDDLWPFKANASAIEDCLWSASEARSDYGTVMARCREEIVQAAKALVAGSVPR
jgi:hypothetical protein